MRAVNRRDMTPNVKVIFSRVRMIFAVCQDADSEVMRWETYGMTRSVMTTGMNA